MEDEYGDASDHEIGREQNEYSANLEDPDLVGPGSKGPSSHDDDAADESAPPKKKKRTKEEKEERKRRKKEKRERKRREREERRQKQKRRRHKAVDEADVVHGAVASDEDEERQHRKKRKAEMTESQAAEIVRGLINRMTAAADEDDEAVSHSQPAVAKLTLLDTVCTEVAKPKWVHWYLREGVCQALARWLSPLPGAVLPNITIRSRILQLLQKMPLYIEHLQGTTLGIRLIAMWKSHEELEDHRSLIREIVHSLLRPVFGVKWSQRAADYSEFDATSIPKTREPPSSGPQSAYMATSTASRRARIPMHTGFSFKVMPKSNFKGLQNETTKDNESTMARLSRMIAYKKTFGSRQATRAHNVSVSKSAM